MKEKLQTCSSNTIARILLFSIFGLMGSCYTTQQVSFDRIKDSTYDSIAIVALIRKDGNKIEYPRKSGVNYTLRNDSLIVFNTTDTILRGPASDFVSMVQVNYQTQSEKDKNVVGAFRPVGLIRMVPAMIGGVIATILLIAILLD